MKAAKSFLSAAAGMRSGDIKTVVDAATPLSSLRADDYGLIIKAIGDSRVVMIGEASHGTEEFYRTRAEITKVLIEKCGFNFVAVEADWPDAYRINRYVKNGSYDASAEASLQDFERFPRWMWRNQVVNDFADWLRGFNDGREQRGKVGFFGMDMYSMLKSANLVIDYLDENDPDMGKTARKRYGFMSACGSHGEGEEYGLAVASRQIPSYEKDVLSMLTDLLRKGPELINQGGGWLEDDELYFTQENARVVKDAEEYYRKSFWGGVRTWNIRDEHMVDTVQSLLRRHAEVLGGRSKCVLWAHNSHLGDASQTDMSKRGEFNVGQRCREIFGADAFNIGFTTYQGTVLAARNWGQSPKVWTLNKGLPDSVEDVMHQVAKSFPHAERDFALVFNSRTDEVTPNEDVVAMMARQRLERYVGVIYAKDTERWSHYSDSSLSRQYDAVIHIDTTSALKPLSEAYPRAGREDMAEGA